MSKSHYIIPIFVPHEGCPHDCVFCNQRSITGSKEIVDAEFVDSTVQKYLETIKNTNSIIEISFFGGTFTAIDIKKQKELLEVALKYKNMGKINLIRLSTRPDYINEPILQNLKAYSVDIIELGIQSMDSEVLIKSGRGHTAEDVINASKLIKAFGFTLGHQIMLGLPGDSFEKDILTTKQVIELKPSICRIYPTLVVKNTALERLYLEGKYTPYTLKETIQISKLLYCMLIANNIKVIRIGLQPTTEINVDGDVIAGPFHPAMRELVEGSLLNQVIYELIPKDYSDKLNIEISINSKEISKLYANKKEFFIDMKNQIKTQNLKVIQNNNLDPGNIVIKYADSEYKVSIYNYLSNKYKEGNLNN